MTALSRCSKSILCDVQRQVHPSTILGLKSKDAETLSRKSVVPAEHEASSAYKAGVPTRLFSSLPLQSLISIINSVIIHQRIGSRQLRSTKRLPTLPATALSVRRPGHSHRIHQPGSLVFAHPDLIAEEGAPKQSQRHEDSSDHAAPTPSSASNRIRPKPLTMEIKEYILC